MNTVLKDFAGNASHLRREELDHCIAAGRCCKAQPLLLIPTAACALSCAGTMRICRLKNVWTLPPVRQSKRSLC